MPEEEAPSTPRGKRLFLLKAVNNGQPQNSPPTDESQILQAVYESAQLGSILSLPLPSLLLEEGEKGGIHLAQAPFSNVHNCWLEWETVASASPSTRLSLSNGDTLLSWEGRGRKGSVQLCQPHPNSPLPHTHPSKPGWPPPRMHHFFPQRTAPKEPPPKARNSWKASGKHQPC